MKKIAVLGAGSWGIALTALLANNGHALTVWSVIPDEVRMLCLTREQKEKLPGVVLPENVEITGDLKAACKEKDMIVLAVPSVYTRKTAAGLKGLIPDGQLIVNVAKGIEDDTLLTLSEQIEEELPDAVVAVLSGPSHAEEVGIGLPTLVTAGAKDMKVAEYVQELFMNEKFRVYTSTDVQGIELGGSIKNVIALAAGIADGLGCGDNTKAALITRGLKEITALGLAMGAQYETLQGLSGLGDLIVTCASMHSRNRRAGYLIGQGASMQEAMDEVKMVVEGVYSARAAKKLAAQYKVSMPIIEAVNQVLFEDKPADKALHELMIRDACREVPVV